MLFYFTLFVAFFYFKLARVHNKEERVDNKVYIMHIIVALSVIALYGYGINHYSFLSIVVVSLIFFIVAALMITAVQVGIFVEGKPFIGMGALYKAMPYIAVLVVFFTLLVWI